MKGAIKTAIVGAAAALFVASVAVAGGQGPGQRPRGMGPGFGGPGGPGPLAGVMRELTDEQRQQVRAIMEERREQGPPVDANLRRQLDAELYSDAPNDAKIEELRQQIIAATGEGLSRHIAVQKRVAQVLTAEQRAKARKQLEEDLAPRGRRGPR